MRTLLLLSLLVPALAHAETPACPGHYAGLSDANSILARLQAAPASQESVITLSSGLEMRGRLKGVRATEAGEPAYLQLDGPSSLGVGGETLAGQGRNRHPHGFGSPVGLLTDGRDLAALSPEDLLAAGMEPGKVVRLEFKSGVVVNGEFQRWQPGPNGKPIVLTFTKCRVKLGDATLFAPSWGDFDMALGASVTDVKTLTETP